MKTRLALSIVCGLLATGCFEENLVPLEGVHFADLNYVTVDAQFCTLPPDPGQEKLKYLFILDHSQSNQPGFPNPLTPGDVTATDPSGTRRYGPLAQFVENLTPDPSNLTSFALIDFNDAAYQPGAVPGFDPSAASFLGTLQTDWIGTGTQAQPVPMDKGFTNYQAALQLAQQLILADAQEEAAIPTTPIVTVTYHVVFVSDGVPTVVAAAGGGGVYTQTFVTDLQPVIQQLMGIRTDPLLGPHISGIELDTAYYYQNTQLPAAEALLAQMANAGNGRYFQFGAGSDITYQNFAPPIRNLRHVLSDVWVDNENAVWWDNGQLLPDSGGSGLPDMIRMEYGGIFGQADSDGNGVSDLVEYRTKGAACRAPGCAPVGRDPYAVCDGLAPVQNAAGMIQYPSTSTSGFNDCEEFVLGANVNTFSTNGTFIPDLLAFKNTLPILPGTDQSAADPFADGISNYQKLKQGLPLSVSVAAVPDFVPRQSTLAHVASADPDQDCYHLVVSNVAVLGSGNRIRVSVIENAAVLDDKPVLRAAEQVVSGQSSPVVFTPNNF